VSAVHKSLLELEPLKRLILILRFMGVKNLEGDVDGNETKTI
jgi:hypothetical protein